MCSCTLKIWSSASTRVAPWISAWRACSRPFGVNLKIYLLNKFWVIWKLRSMKQKFWSCAIIFNSAAELILHLINSFWKSVKEMISWKAKIRLILQWRKAILQISLIIKTEVIVPVIINSNSSRMNLLDLKINSKFSLVVWMIKKKKRLVLYRIHLLLKIQLNKAQ